MFMSSGVWDDVTMGSDESCKTLAGNWSEKVPGLDVKGGLSLV